MTAAVSRITLFGSKAFIFLLIILRQHFESAVAQGRKRKKSYVIYSSLSSAGTFLLMVMLRDSLSPLEDTRRSVARDRRMLRATGGSELRRGY